MPRFAVYIRISLVEVIEEPGGSPRLRDIKGIRHCGVGESQVGAWEDAWGRVGRFVEGIRGEVRG